ncbi:DUF6877 family protein [Clostridioides difficile]|uniref:DUF6877 family protein n=2 Tax=Clostridioides difficile TaxID=1496 RepID=UPI001F37B720|nr:DUF6877 family protein [Clostridioides difficile]
MKLEVYRLTLTYKKDDLNMNNKVEINNIQQLNDALNKYNIPFDILSDVDRRICDWMATGGNEDDAYIKQQYRYVENFINLFCD